MSEITILANFLERAIENAPQADRDQLAQGLQDYAEKFSRSMDSKRHSPMLRKFVEAMIEGSDARVEY